MWFTRVFGLLLPLGIWLVMSISTSRERDLRLSLTGILTFVIAVLAFYLSGFAFMFGGIGAVYKLNGLSQYVTFLTLPLEQQVWGLLGLRGFMLAGVGEDLALSIFISFLPLIVSGAMIIAGALTTRLNLFGLSIAVAVTSGVILPIVGFWMWGGGWLAESGLNLSFGHGSVDMGGLTTVALVSGSVGLAHYLLSAKSVVHAPQQLPQSYHPLRALGGIVLIVVGASAFISGNPLYTSFVESIVAPYFINVILAIVCAVTVALIYTVFVARQPGFVFAGRSALAALISTSAGAVLFPGWLSIALGALAGLLCSVGHFYTNRIVKHTDDSGIISAVFLPSILGLLCVGLFANGLWAQGWNGVGAGTYLGQSGLGIIGAIAVGGIPTDPGQLTAQIIAIFAIFIFSFAAYIPFAILLRTAYQRQRLPSPEFVAHTPPVTLTPVLRTEMDSEVVMERPPMAANPGTAAATRPQTLVARLLHVHNTKAQPEAPSQSRRVAYPNRFRGRRIQIRPFGRASEPPHPTEDSTSAN